MQHNPIEVYKDQFRLGSKSGIPLSTKLSMLYHAPLTAFGIGPKSWRAAELATRQRTVLSNEAKKSIAGMAVG